ncbi:MAG: carbohydrate kinase family protein, partial [Proteobacteria bacterium]|nr:carbohydrate kinase family protein [Pseudomonadota bacterium]
ADILKLNGDELRLIGEMLNVTGEASAVVRRLMTIYGLELVAVTLGEAGSFIVSEEKRYDAPIPEKSDMVDTVGAGDAFAAVLALGCLRRIPMNSVLQIATNFATRICACPGAIPDDDSPYKKVIRQPEGLQK